MPNSHYHSEPSLLPLDRPRCPRCQGRMMLSRIEPGPSVDVDLRTFECPKCEHVYKIVAGDPMKSGALGWINAGLRPPE